LIIHIKVSYDQNISWIFFVKDGSFVRLQHPSCVYITAQRQYTAVQRCVHLWNNFSCIITLIGVTLYTHMSEVFTTKPQRIHFSPEVLFFQLQNPALPFLLRQLQPTISCLHSSQKLKYTLLNINKVILFPEVWFKKKLNPEAEFKEFELWLKYGWFHLKLYSDFKDLSRRSVETGFWGIWEAT